MEPEKTAIPDELKTLNPEMQKEVIVVGTEAYFVYPMTEGQVERMSRIISEIFEEIFTTDMVCPSCRKVFRNAMGRVDVCNQCADAVLEPKQKSPVEALTREDRIVKIVEELVGIKAAKVKEGMTIAQFKHAAGVIYKQNFKDEGVVPEESAKNFKALLDMLGLGANRLMGGKAEEVKAEVEGA